MKYALKIFISLGVGVLIAVLSRGGYLGSLGKTGIPFSAYTDCKMRVLGSPENLPHMVCKNFYYGDISIIFNIFFWAIVVYLIVGLVEHVILAYKKN